MPLLESSLVERGRDFTWRDADRSILLRSGGLAAAAGILARRGLEEYALLSTERALGGAPKAMLKGASAILEVPGGQVPETSAALLDRAGGHDLVALGGGRVIDTAKAIAAAAGGRVAAIPTTLSGAEMTAIHRLPAGVEDAPLVRPQLVLWDPDLLRSLGEPDLRATAMNALAHGAEALYGPGANPIASMLALEGAREIATALDGVSDDRLEQLAYGSMLCGYAIDSAGLGFHHALCQTVVRVCGVSHSGTYAALLPVTMEWVRDRAPASLDELAAAIGAEGAVAERLRGLGGSPPGLGELGADDERMDEILATAGRREQMERTPGGAPSEAELRGMLEAAW